jgi:two-component system, chemotaxis family, protein-glutamate methylesterase/glutaminase
MASSDMRIAKPPVRVLILDPSAETRATLRRCVEAGAGLQVAGAAATAEQAIDMAASAMPDVILVGDRPPRVDATASVRHIMHVRPLPIVIVTPGASAGEGARAFNLMEAGALAVVREPPESPAAERVHATANMLQTLALMAEVRVVRRWRRLDATESAPVAGPAPAAPAPLPARRRAGVVAIGASTGGPIVLKTILAGLPRSFPVPILIVQHISDGFVDGLAEWLTVSGNIPTHLAGGGQVLKPGHAYLAPDGAHMRLTADGSLAFDRTDPVKGHRPAISCLFRSVAEHRGPNAVGILLTGMGTDGSAELKLMKDAGAITIAQDRASSVVHGMAGEAIRCGGAVHVMSPQQIAAALPALVA